MYIPPKQQTLGSRYSPTLPVAGVKERSITGSVFKKQNLLMARYSDNAPIGHTCPMIDKVIDFINSVEWSEDERDLEDDSKKALHTMEEIRKANSTLRDWGNEECKKAIEFENDLDYANRQIKDLEEEIKSLKSDVAYYENQELEKTA